MGKVDKENEERGFFRVENANKTAPLVLHCWKLREKAQNERISLIKQKKNFSLIELHFLIALRSPIQVLAGLNAAASRPTK